MHTINQAHYTQQTEFHWGPEDIKNLTILSRQKTAIDIVSDEKSQRIIFRIEVFNLRHTDITYS